MTYLFMIFYNSNYPANALYFKIKSHISNFVCFAMIL